MKGTTFAFSLVAAAAVAAAPLAAQTSNGPWWDPGRTQTQTTPRNGSVFGSNGRVYGNNGRVYGQQQVQADGVWRAYSRDRSGNTVYMRTRYDSNGQLIQEYATRNIIGRYNVIDRQVLSNGNGNYGNYGTYGTYGNRSSVYDARAREAEIRRQQEIQREEQLRRQAEINRNAQYSRDAQLRREAEIRQSQNQSNDRWSQNNGHDNGKHNGQYKDKDKHDHDHDHDHDN